MPQKVGDKINVGDLAIRFVIPQDASYASEVAAKGTYNHLLIDYKDGSGVLAKVSSRPPAEGENHYRYYYRRSTSGIKLQLLLPSQ